MYLYFRTVSYKVPVPIQYESGPSSQDSQPSTKAELNEARDILSEILNDIFTTRKGIHSMIYLNKK